MHQAEAAAATTLALATTKAAPEVNELTNQSVPEDATAIIARADRAAAEARKAKAESRAANRSRSPRSG